MSYAIARNRGANSDINKLYPEDRPIHEWYRFVLSFPPHLVHNTYLPFTSYGLNATEVLLPTFSVNDDNGS
jgi:hypothetical protein